MKTTNIKKNRIEKQNTRLLLAKSVIKGKMKLIDAAQCFWVNYCTASKRCRIARLKWFSALNAKKNTGWRPKKKNNNLTPIEKKSLEVIINKEPREYTQMQLDFWLRTIKIIQKLIVHVTGKKLKYRKVRQFLEEIGYTNQKPIYKAYQQDPEKVEKRVNEILPSILTEAQTEWRTVYYGDEAWFKSTDHKGKTRSKRWSTPTVQSTGLRFGVNAISIISSKWEMRFMVYEWSFTSQTLITFLQRLVRGTNKKYTLILDGHPTHKSKKVREYLESIDYQVKIYYLPWYSPEYNPDELLWNCVKSDLKWNVYRSKKELCDKLLRSLHSHQKQKSKIKNFFSKK